MFENNKYITMGNQQASYPITSGKRRCDNIEKWKNILGTEDYQISNKGRVRSFKQYSKGYVMKQSYDKDGYLKVTIQGEGKEITRRVHVWVAQAFIPNPENLPQVNHKNGIKTDNNVDNLEWVTPQENTIHAYKNGLNQNVGAKHHYANRYKVIRKGQILSYYDNLHQLVDSLKTSRGNVLDAIKRGEIYDELKIIQIDEIPKTDKLNIELVTREGIRGEVLKPFKVEKLINGEIKYYKSASECERELPISRRTLAGKEVKELKGYRYTRVTAWEYLTQ